METSVKLHDPAVLPAIMKPQAHIDQEAGWIPERVQTL
jgi:hypothetical protein